MAESAPASSRSGWPLGWLFVVLLGLSLWFTTRAWHAPILDRHEFRQTQTAYSAHWLRETGFRLDYETPLFGPPWTLPFEFPLYQGCVAATSRLLGTGLEPTARGLSLLFFLTTLPALYGLAGLLHLAPSRRLLVLGLVLASPTYLFYARTVMIETAALCCAGWFLYTGTRAVRDRHPGFALIATVFAVLAGLTKVTTLAVFLPPAAVLAWLFWKNDWTNRRASPAAFLRATACAVVPVALGLLGAIAWVRYSDQLKLNNPYAAEMISGKLSFWTWGNVGQRLSPAFWRQCWDTVSSLVLAPLPFFTLLVGACLVPPFHRRVALGGLAAFVLASLTFANLYFIHDYYYCASAVFLLGGAGFVLVGLWDAPHLPSLAKWAFLVAVLGGQLHAYYVGYGSYTRRVLPNPPGLAAVVRAVTTADQAVVIYGWDWNSLIPYYAKRRAVMVPAGRENETDVLDHILRPLAPGKIAGLLIRPLDAPWATPEFIRARLNHFKLALTPFASSPDGDLYLPEENLPTAANRVGGQTFRDVTLRLEPAPDPFAAQLHDTELPDFGALPFSPHPVKARSLFGLTLRAERNQTVLLAHAVSELHFTPPAGATHLQADFGLTDSAFAPENESASDGITVEIFELLPNGVHRTLFRRDLDPGSVVTDQGTQSIHLTLDRPLTGTLVCRMSPGLKDNLNSDWAYWSRFEIR